MMPSSEVFGTGLKGRVTACRHRLRVNRVAQRVKVNNDAEESLPTVSSLQDYAAGSSRTASSVGMVYSSSLADGRDGEGEKLVLVGEPEVGIT